MAGARREAPEDDAVPTRIGQAVMLHRGGDREEARNRLAELWRELHDGGVGGDPFHRCALAHYIADTQDDPADELMWDLLALAAADRIAGADGRPTATRVRAFYPSLHLNLAADYAKLGRREAARGQLALARASARGAGDGPYGVGVRAAIHRLALRLGG
ncbi:MULTISPECIES: hypothetical protein [Streptomyces]|uniref:Tetratricopeptide repeat protein n=1 Tax=Streptomyces lonegramiae TaxID=3075524 RepID=A0ABU2XSV9_9ACTN|nr:hypothetical protein [Streptomyces sp. DSM 41529]MDT0549004.1 hypothetical protein [Streptomyces sp. DSM 41529]